MVAGASAELSSIERHSVAELFERYADSIYNFCRRLTGNPHIAEDLTQEVFVRAIRFEHSFEGRCGHSTWLYAIASNLCRDYFQKSKRLCLVEPETLENLAGAALETAHQQAIEQEMSLKIEQALAQLTEIQREVLVLSRYHHKSYAEIAQITGQNVNAIKQMMFRALARLKSIFKEFGLEKSGYGL